MSNQNIFRPTLAGNATMLATTTSGRIALPVVVGIYNRALRVMNTGLVEAFFQVGGASVVAVAGGSVNATPDGSVAILPGVVELFLLHPGETHIAAITGTSTAVLRISLGEGR